MTPGWHVVTHLATAGCIGWVGWLVWRNRPSDQNADTVAAIDTDLALVETDVAALWPHVVALTHVVYELLGQPVPEPSAADVHRAKRDDDGEPTEEHPAVDPDDEGPATDVADRADTFARKLHVLSRLNEPQTPGRHRTEAPVGNVHEIVDGIPTRLLPQLHPNSFVGGGPVGEGPTATHKTEGESDA